MSETPIGFLQFARIVLDALVAADVEYLIGGSVGLWAWGELRTTRDFDLVVNLPVERIYALSKELERRDMLVPPDVIVDLLLQPEGDLPINAIQLNTGYKAEFFLLREGDVFRANALARRRSVDYGPPIGEAYVHAPEDLILNKIRYFSLSYQTKHVGDIASIMEFSRDLVDIDYINTWAKILGLTETWERIQKRIADNELGAE